MSGTPIAGDTFQSEGQAGRMGSADGHRSRGPPGASVFLRRPKSTRRSRAARSRMEARGEISGRLTGVTGYSYGLTKWRDLFARRRSSRSQPLPIWSARQGSAIRGAALSRSGGGWLAFARRWRGRLGIRGARLHVYLGRRSEQVSRLHNCDAVQWGKSKVNPCMCLVVRPFQWCGIIAEVNPLSGASGGFDASR